MAKLIKIEFLKLFSNRKMIYLYSILIGLVLCLALFLKTAAPDSSFGGSFNTICETFSIFAIIVGSILTLTSISQEMQQKTLKIMLVTPIKRSNILFSKFLVSIFSSLIVLVTLYCLSFLISGVLFGFFATGIYTTSEENMTLFFNGSLQIITAFFTTIFYSSLILLLFILLNSLPITLVCIIFIRGFGEMITRTLLEHNNLFLLYSPFGILSISNPLSTSINLVGYLSQLVLSVIYTLILLKFSFLFFDKKEF